MEGQWKEENKRGVKAGTTPQCFLSLAPWSRNIIVNISSELLAPIQTPASACAGGGLAAGFKPHHTHTHTYIHTTTAINPPPISSALKTRKAPQQQDVWSLKSCPALITSPSFLKTSKHMWLFDVPLISANFKFSEFLQ